MYIVVSHQLHFVSLTCYFIFLNNIHMALHNLNINCNLILFSVFFDHIVSIIEPSNNTLCKSFNLVILNVHKWFTKNRLILNINI